jgi:hypothetical protein
MLYDSFNRCGDFGQVLFPKPRSLGLIPSKSVLYVRRCCGA